MSTSDVQVRTRLNWSHVIAFAWWTTDANGESMLLNDLRKNPREAIDQLSKDEQGKYNQLLSGVEDKDVRGRIVSAALTIKQQTEETPNMNYRGFLPIPSKEEVGALADLDTDKLAVLLSIGIAGTLGFYDPDDPEQADLWAQELLHAWQDDSYRIAILKDPVGNLKNQAKLKSILPLPDRPRGLECLEIEKLQELLGDQDHMQHLGGIFAYGS